jgi:hypothetical protein
MSRFEASRVISVALDFSGAKSGGLRDLSGLGTGTDGSQRFKINAETANRAAATTVAAPSRRRLPANPF